MKFNVVTVVLLLVCLGLVVALVVSGNKHAEETTKQEDTIHGYSNRVTTVEGKLAEQMEVNSTLSTNLEAAKIKASNDLAAVRADLSNSVASLEKSEADAKTAAADDAAKLAAAMAEKDKKISELENQNVELDKQDSDLRGAITNLETQIQTTQKKLDADEGDKKLLMAELARLQAQKNDLEKKLSDLAFLKETVKKLRDDLSIARRLDWIRRGIYDSISEKGGERLIHPMPTAPATNNGALNVELRQGGGVNVTTPGGTNTPPPQ
jgi:chromosome segregation ATPase